MHRRIAVGAAVEACACLLGQGRSPSVDADRRARRRSVRQRGRARPSAIDSCCRRRAPPRARPQHGRVYVYTRCRRTPKFVDRRRRNRQRARRDVSSRSSATSTPTALPTATRPTGRTPPRAVHRARLRPFRQGRIALADPDRRDRWRRASAPVRRTPATSTATATPTSSSARGSRRRRRVGRPSVSLLRQETAGLMKTFTVQDARATRSASTRCRCGDVDR